MIPVPAHLSGIVHRYYLPPTTPLGVNGDSWSLWLLDQDTCSLSIVSDYGNWAHLWGRDGVRYADWRVQFLSLGREYLADKLSYGVERVFDVERVVQNIRENIVARRRKRRECRDTAREWYDAARWIEDAVDFERFNILTDHAFDDFYAQRIKNSGWLEHLMTVSLLRVKAMIRAELEAEEGVAAQ